MSKVTIYHNPRCSKSRQTLALLEEHGIQAQQRLYLESPPDVAELRSLLSMLGLSARQLLRKSEQEYKDLGLAEPTLSEDRLIEAMSQNPRLIERPIVVRDNRAILGRPPENVLNLL